MSVLPLVPGYRLEKKLGEGGMATVYLALEEKLQRHVALKVLELLSNKGESLASRFIKEARTAASLHHTHIIQVYDVGQLDNLYYIAMEYLPHGSLKDRIVTEKSILPDEAMRILQALALALGHAHKKGIVHRDIKPDNVLFREDGTPVLADFGIAKALGGATQYTKTGTSIGTPHYMSPEQASGKDLDGRSDFYSLGIMYYEMLTGSVPYQGSDVIQIAIRHLQDPIPLLPTDFPDREPQQQLLNAMLAKSPDDRVESRDALVQLTQDVLSGPLEMAWHPPETGAWPQLKTPASSGIRTIRTPNSQPVVERTRKKQIALLSIALGLLVLAVLGLLNFGSRGDDRNSPFQSETPVVESPVPASPGALEETDLTVAAPPVSGMVENNNGQEEKKAFEVALKAGGSQGMRDFLQLYDTGPYADMARKITEQENQRLDAEDFRKANDQGSLKGYRDYLKKYPQGFFADKAQERIREIEAIAAADQEKRSRIEAAAIAEREKEKAAFDAAMAAGGKQPLLDYLSTYPAGDYAVLARQQVERENRRQDAENFRKASERGGLKDYQAYLAEYPKGEFREIALLKIEAFEKARRDEERKLMEREADGKRIKDAEDFEKAVAKNNPQAFQDYLKAHPDGQFRKKASDRIRELNAKTEVKKSVEEDVETRDFLLAMEKDQREALDDFVRKYPGSRHLVQVDRRIKEMDRIPLAVRKMEKKGAKTSLNDLGYWEMRLPQNIALIYVPGGSFTMGEDRGADNPANSVELSPFWVGKYEITQAEWQAVMGNNPAKNKGEATRPVENITWYDALQFCDTLKAKTGHTVRLLSEAEWEFVARGSLGSQSKSDLEAAAWTANNSKGRSHPVGEKKASIIGVHDLLGNVFEWCMDTYDKQFYLQGNRKNPHLSGGGGPKVIRGGSWFDQTRRANPTKRDKMPGGEKSGTVGFRIAIEND